MRSMTGFGVGDAPLGDGRVVCEARSLNHRYLDVRVTVPPELGAHAFHLEQLARARFERGRLDVVVRLEGAGLGALELDVERARAAFQALRRLRDELAPDQDLPLELLAAAPDLFRQPRGLDGATTRAALTAAFGHALDALETMRGREGRALAEELARLLASLREHRGHVARAAPELAAAARRRLRERLDRLLDPAQIQLDAGRLEAELAVLADRSDVTEELARLDIHFAELDKLLGSDEPVGRRLDFLLQEVGREANTIGAKCQDAAMAHRVVALKTDIERMRQQGQNVE
jgi:uncharacterized protein (TIGR00255 family)